MEGFRQIVIRSSIQADLLLVDVLFSGQHNDWRLSAIIAKLLANLRSGETREFPIQDDGVVLVELQPLQPVRSFIYRVGHVSLALKPVHQQAGELFIVFDYQDFGHSTAVSAPSRKEIPYYQVPRSWGTGAALSKTNKPSDWRSKVWCCATG